MKKILFLLAITGFIASCTNEKNLYQPTHEEKTILDYSLTSKINIVSDLPDNTRCLAYTVNPEGEGSKATPIMVAYAPFSLDVPVAKSVEKIYLYVNGKINVYDRGSITVKASSFAIQGSDIAKTRSDEEPGSATQITIEPAFITAINDYYPEALVNVWDDNIRKSSDLVSIKGNDQDIEYEGTKVWITYITNGGASFNGSLWYYTYNVDANNQPATPLEELQPVQIFSGAGPSESFPNGPGSRVYLGQFEPGLRIGFKYQGTSQARYSTPHYNAVAYPDQSSGGSWKNTYNGTPISGNCSDYKDNYFACGVIRAFTYNGTEYATLGMENRLPSESEWDGDFNDMICLIEATPLVIENDIPPPDPDPSTIKFAGYWLFEDNYPHEGDYDFNDFVVRYAITEYPETSQLTVIDLQFMARGADFKNSFGVNGKLHYHNLNGYINVRMGDEKGAQPIHQMTVTKAERYVPMMNNGIYNFDLDTYWDEGETFPCVLEIPITDITNTDEIVEPSQFLWCRENERIDHAYPRYKDWVESGCKEHTDWYLDTPVAQYVWDK